MTIFRQKGGGAGLSQKNLYQKKTEVVKKRGGGLSFLTQSKKNSFFMAPQISSLWIVRRVSPMITVYYRISNQPCGRRRINSLKFGDQPSSGTCGGHWHHLEVRDAHLYQNVRFFIKFIKGGGVISVYKNLCCKFCIVQEAFWQQFLSDPGLLVRSRGLIVCNNSDLKRSFYVHFCCKKASWPIQNLQHKFL